MIYAHAVNIRNTFVLAGSYSALFRDTSPLNLSCNKGFCPYKFTGIRKLAAQRVHRNFAAT